jgi:gluconolactonase
MTRDQSDSQPSHKMSEVRRPASRLGDLISASNEVTKLADGFIFTEGPIWMADGSLHFSDIPANTRYRWHRDEGVSIVRSPSNKCNGMTRAGDDALIVCEHLTSRVVSETPDGESSVILASRWSGKELNSPNDIIVAHDGTIFFTDPDYGRSSDIFGKRRACQLDVRGVYRVQPNKPDADLLLNDFDQPNGLGLSPDESLLYVNDTARAHVRVFPMHGGLPKPEGRVFAEGISASAACDDSYVDGMKVDEVGNIYVTGPGGIWVFAADGERIGIIEVPEKVANLNWGDPDWKTLYITASTSIYSLRMQVAGNLLLYMR